MQGWNISKALRLKSKGFHHPDLLLRVIHFLMLAQICTGSGQPGSETLYNCLRQDLHSW